MQAKLQPTTVRKIPGDKSVCRTTKPGKAWTSTIPLLLKLWKMVIRSRENFMTCNVGKPKTTYNVRIDMPDVKVEPCVLSLTDVKEKKSFCVEVNGPHITRVLLYGEMKM